MFDAISGLLKGDPKVEVSFDEKPGVSLIRKYHSRLVKGEDEVDHQQHLSDTYLPCYKNKSEVSGVVDILLPDNVDTLKYDSIQCYLIGQVVCPQLGKDHVFVSMSFPLQHSAGSLHQSTRYKFKFLDCNLNKDSFYGSIVEQRYFVRVVINKRGLVSSSAITHEEDFYVQNPSKAMERKMLKMEVGVEDCLHLEFNYDSSQLHTQSKIKGNVLFGLNLIKIRSMMIQILRREIVNTGVNKEPELVHTHIIGKYQIMDGCPVKGEIIPILIPMTSMPDLSISMETKQFCVRYYLNLVLVDVDGRRYFKSNEIKIWRK